MNADNIKLHQRLKAVDVGDYGMTLFTDLSTPLIIEFQLFWFDERITEFLSRAPGEMFVCSNGIRIGLASEFKYTPAEMETEEGYLTGFSSNTQFHCYDKMTITVDTEEEKFGVCTEVTQALSELVRAATNLQPGVSPVIRWSI
jgi:hypothetical protein